MHLFLVIFHFAWYDISCLEFLITDESNCWRFYTIISSLARLETKILDLMTSQWYLDLHFHFGGRWSWKSRLNVRQRNPTNAEQSALNTGSDAVQCCGERHQLQLAEQSGDFRGAVQQQQLHVAIVALRKVLSASLRHWFIYKLSVIWSSGADSIGHGGHVRLPLLQMTVKGTVDTVSIANKKLTKLY